MLLRSELLCAQTLLGEATYPLEELESGDIQSYPSPQLGRVGSAPTCCPCVFTWTSTMLDWGHAPWSGTVGL